MDFVLSRQLGNSFFLLEQFEYDLSLEGRSVSSFHTDSLHDPWTGHCPNSLGHYTYLDPLIAGKVVDRVVHAAPLVPERQAAMLSEREFEVLQQVAQGYSSKEIATKLNLSSKTVETYKARAMEKLGLNGRAAIVRYAIAQGWLQQTP